MSKESRRAILNLVMGFTTFGLAVVLMFVPSMWLSGIVIGFGIASVINCTEALLS